MHHPSFPLFNKLNIILASASPRRYQLLKESGINFNVVIPNVNENYPSFLKAESIALYVCKLKADSINIDDYPDNTVIITADTIVWLNGEKISKPKDRQDASNILNKLSGNMHEVITGVLIKAKKRDITFAEKTKVYFKLMDKEEIDYYLDNYSPYDKAGAYGVQEWIGHTCISRIEGSFVNIMGLPVKQVFEALKKFAQDKSL